MAGVEANGLIGDDGPMLAETAHGTDRGGES